MLEKLKMLKQVLTGNAIVIQMITDNNIKVDCGKNITKEFARKSVATTLTKLW